MSMLIALLTGGGLVAAGAVINGVVTGILNGRAARETRRQDRLDQAYIELGQYLSHYWDWARSVQPFWGPVPPPDAMLPQERWHVEALVRAYGSQEVRDLLEEWQVQARKIELADDIIRRVEQSPNPSAEADQQALREKRALLDYKEAMQHADEAIRAQMRRELGVRRSRSLRRSKPQIAPEPEPDPQERARIEARREELRQAKAAQERDDDGDDGRSAP
jgi:hypothetical protein